MPISQRNKQIIDKLKKSDLTNYDNLYLIFQTARNVLNEDGDIEEAMKIADNVKRISQKLACRGKEFFDLYNKCLLFRAPYFFDDYLLYLEKNRQYKDMFYLPKRKQFMKLGLIQLMQDLEDDKLDIVSISLPPGTGKAQPMYSKILTLDGFIEMKDVKVGTTVISGTGRPSKVLGVYPQGVRKIYELTFDDGSICRCSDEHLWTVQTRDDRRDRTKAGRIKYRTITLNDMLKNIKVENGKRCNYSIDYVPRIDFSKKQFIIHPYVMGVLIGDGGLANGTPLINTIDQDIIDAVNSFLPDGYYLKHKDKCTYLVHGHEGNNCKAGSIISIELKRLGLFGKKSIDKFIPDSYLYSDYEQRLWLLRGLMDTDGYAPKKGTNCEFATISERLARDVKELVNSLGGYASISKSKAGYKKDGLYIQCNDCYTVTIGFSLEQPNPFHLKRKAERYKPKRKELKRFITDIKFIGYEECQCIYIDDPSHLYITDNYIITHNTTLEKFFASWVIGRHPDDYNLFFSHSGDITRMFYDGVLDITTSDEYTWGEIFPDVKLQSTDAKRECINFNKYKPFPNLQCTSIGSKNAGKVRCNRYLFCDDLIGGIEEALNKNILDKIWRIYGTDARQRKLNDQVKEIHIATRWSVHDVIGRLQQAYQGNPRAKFIAVPDIDPVTGESNFDYEYNGLTVEFFKDQELLMDEISYKCLYKNEPIEREGLLYTDDDIRRYLTLPLEEPDAILAICDTKDKGTDFLFLPVLYQYGDDYYCVDCICDDDSDYGKQYENCARILVEHKVQQCQFESNNGGSRVAYEVNKLVEQKGGRCNITSKVSSGNKETKIIVNADWVKKHVLFKDKSLYKPKDDYGKMMAFLLSYTVKGKNEHDDVPDGLAMFALFVSNMYGAKATVYDRRSLGI